MLFWPGNAEYVISEPPRQCRACAYRVRAASSSCAAAAAPLWATPEPRNKLMKIQTTKLQTHFISGVMMRWEKQDVCGSWRLVQSQCSWPGLWRSCARGWEERAGGWPAPLWPHQPHQGKLKNCNGGPVVARCQGQCTAAPPALHHTRRNRHKGEINTHCNQLIPARGKL